MKKRRLAGKFLKKVVGGIFKLTIISLFSFGFVYLLFLAPFSYEEKMTTSEIQKRQEILERGIK